MRISELEEIFEILSQPPPLKYKVMEGTEMKEGTPPMVGERVLNNKLTLSF